MNLSQISHLKTSTLVFRNYCDPTTQKNNEEIKRLTEKLMHVDDNLKQFGLNASINYKALATQELKKELKTVDDELKNLGVDVSIDYKIFETDEEIQAAKEDEARKAQIQQLKKVGTTVLKTAAAAGAIGIIFVAGGVASIYYMFSKL